MSAVAFAGGIGEQSHVGIPGLEPGTSSLSAKRSNRLSYIPDWADARLPDPAPTFESSRSQRQLLVKPTSRPPVIFTLRL